MRGDLALRPWAVQSRSSWNERAKRVLEEGRRGIETDRRIEHLYKRDVNTRGS